jgi:predicted nucleic acid-binding protein
MSGRSFLDTNILVYAIEVDGAEPGKSERARTATREAEVVISTQVLGEFYNAVTSTRRASPLTRDEAAAWVQLWKRMEVVDVTVAHVDLAIAIADEHRINYYDALILAAARLANCAEVQSEDLQSERDYGGVTVRNPLAP